MAHDKDDSLQIGEIEDADNVKIGEVIEVPAEEVMAEINAANF